MNSLSAFLMTMSKHQHGHFQWSLLSRSTTFFYSQDSKHEILRKGWLCRSIRLTTSNGVSSRLSLNNNFLFIRLKHETLFTNSEPNSTWIIIMLVQSADSRSHRIDCEINNLRGENWFQCSTSAICKMQTNNIQLHRQQITIWDIIKNCCVFS